MKDKSNQQLLQIVGSKQEEYQPLAILAARVELKRRNIDPDTIQQGNVLSDDDKFSLKSTMAFGWYHKAGMLVLPFFIGGLFHWLMSLAGSPALLQFLGFPFLFLCYYLLHQQLKTNGYEQMAIDFKHWISYTVYIYMGILVLGALILLTAMLFA